MIAATIFEVLLFALIILGFIFEHKLVEWEDKLFSAIKKKFNERKALSRREKLTVISNEYR